MTKLPWDGAKDLQGEDFGLKLSPPGPKLVLGEVHSHVGTSEGP